MISCVVNGEPGQHEWDHYNRRCNRCGKTGFQYIIEYRDGTLEPHGFSAAS